MSSIPVQGAVASPPPAAASQVVSAPHRLARLAVWLAPLLVVLALAPTLAVPFERDEGEYAWAATLWGRGGVPYRDTFLQKPPGIIVAYRLAQLTLGPGPVGAHLVMLALYALAALATAALARRLAGARGALFAGVAFALPLSAPYTQATAFNTEALVVLGTAVAALALDHLRTERRLRWALLVGGGAALALFGKQVAAPHVALLVATAAALGRTHRERLRWGGSAAAIVAAPYLASLAYFAARGALHPFLDGVLLHNIEYTGRSLEAQLILSYGRRSRLPHDWLFPALALLAAGGGLRLLRLRAWWPAWLLGSWVVAASLGVSAGGFFRGHYFQQLVPPVAVLVGLQLAAWARWASVPVVGALAVAWYAAGGVTYGKSLSRLSAERYPFEPTVFANGEPLAAWLDARMGARGDRTLYVAASEPELYHFSGAEPITPYVIQDPLYGGYPSSRRRQEEVWAAIVRRPPAFVVGRPPELASPIFDASDRWLVHRLDSLLAARYTLAAVTRVGVIGVAADARTVADSLREYLVYERRP